MHPTRSLLIAFILAIVILPVIADAGQKPPPAQDLQAQITALAARVSTLEGQVSTLQNTVNTQAAQITALQTDLSAVQTSGVMALNDYLTVTTDTRGPLVRFSGVNIQLVNGTGNTGDNSHPPNGLGNLIIGYDAVRVDAPLFHSEPICSIGYYSDETSCGQNGGTWAISHKTGSHYLVVGDAHNYSRYSGIVAGNRNGSHANYASVIGGSNNYANEGLSTVFGGSYNTSTPNCGSETLTPATATTADIGFRCCMAL